MKRGELGAEVVSAVFGEAVEQTGRPIGAVVFEGIVELGPRHGGLEVPQRLVKGGGIGRDGCG